jgi:hypothetical protein
VGFSDSDVARLAGTLALHLSIHVAPFALFAVESSGVAWKGALSQRPLPA